MIGPDDVRRWAESLYDDFLRSVVQGEALFPLRRDRLGRVPAADDPATFARLVSPLWEKSKQVRGVGYKVVLEPKQRRSRSFQNEPVAVEIETADDYLALIEKRHEADRFAADVGLILQQLPDVRAALCANPRLVITNHGDWSGILKVVTYLRQHPRPGCFVRALPVLEHTKFIETHQEAIETLLAVLPESGYDPAGKTFALRCGLREDEPDIRGRFLCPGLQKACGFPTADVVLRVTAWAGLDLPPEAKVLACENKTNFLALPPMVNTLALWGQGGAATGLFPRLPWLNRTGLVYWGDLDPCGLAILAKLRGSLPNVNSVLMDASTLALHRDKLRKALLPPGGIGYERLTASEESAARELAESAQGIEQEKLLFEDCIRAAETALESHG